MITCKTQCTQFTSTTPERGLDYGEGLVDDDGLIFMTDRWQAKGPSACRLLQPGHDVAWALVRGLHKGRHDVDIRDGTQDVRYSLGTVCYTNSSTSSPIASEGQEDGEGLVDDDGLIFLHEPEIH